MSEFENIKVGDKVFYTTRFGWRDRKPQVDVVIKVTKTQFCTETGRFNKKNGKGIGSNIWSSAYNPEKHDKEIQAFKDRQLKKKCINIISEKCKILDLEELKQIANKILKREKGE